MLVINDKLQKDNASYLVLVGLGHQLSQLLGIDVDLICPHKAMHLAFDYKGKNYNIYTDKKYPTSIQTIFNCYGEERYFEEYNGVAVLNYFRSLVNMKSYKSYHIYAFKESTSGLVFKLQRAPNGDYYWGRLDSTEFNYNGVMSQFALPIINMSGISVQEFTNYESFLQWLYCNK